MQTCGALAIAAGLHKTLQRLQVRALRRRQGLQRGLCRGLCAGPFPQGFRQLSRIDGHPHMLSEICQGPHLPLMEERLRAQCLGHLLLSHPHLMRFRQVGRHPAAAPD